MREELKVITAQLPRNPSRSHLRSFGDSKLVSKGGHATIYQDDPSRPVVRKRYARSRDTFAYWVRENTALKLLKDAQGIIRYLKLGADIHLPKFAYSLYHLLVAKPVKLDLRQKLEIGYQLILGVWEMHRRGLIHRDLKAPNVLVNLDPLEVVIIDFGTLKYAPVSEPWCQTHTRCILTPNKTTLVTTLPYQAPELNPSFPEQYRVNYDQQIDVWSLGIILGHLWLDHMPLWWVKDQTTHWDQILHHFHLYNRNEIRTDPEKILMYTPIQYQSFTQKMPYNFPTELQFILHQMLQINPQHRVEIWDLVNYVYFQEQLGATPQPPENHLDRIRWLDQSLNYPELMIDRADYFDQSQARIVSFDLVLSLLQIYHLSEKFLFEIVDLCEIYWARNPESELSPREVIYGMFIISYFVECLEISYDQAVLPLLGKRVSQIWDLLYRLVEEVGYVVYQTTVHDYLMAAYQDADLPTDDFEEVYRLLLLAYRQGLDLCLTPDGQRYQRKKEKLVANLIHYRHLDWSHPWLQKHLDPLLQREIRALRYPGEEEVKLPRVMIEIDYSEKELEEILWEEEEANQAHGILKA